LGECLDKVSEEAERQKNETAASLLELQRNAEKAQAKPNANTESDIDPVTGLPSQAAAKATFAAALSTPGRKFIITMVVDRMQPINARFGNAVGDRLLRALRKYVEAKVISEGDRLFRWSGPTLVALMSRQESIDQVRGSLKRLLDVKLDNEVNVGDRSAIIPLSVAWSVMGLIPPAVNIPSFIDRFVAAQTPRDYC
jgi:GGDEF domain-containing protein